MRILLLILGWICVVLGVIGIILPIMPTTPFLLVAVWCFARSSPRFEQWLYNHPSFGPPLTAWRDRREVPRRAKVIAIVCMAAGYASTMIFFRPPWFVFVPIGLILVACAIFVATRNEPEKNAPAE